ncbi:hypothetical protein L1787_15810 [Acuticoccus sp. M5D2P5]|uniref:hypothetical protein n=1 Tax=Acuticoccus kalidii TaxID=2910977 RepID=UPI001F1FAF15|nr:hypothetical protein [Acuticoccus kalidii]MCF3934869.1 hypothetical protein [Acuticoccus kalidii]
MTFVDLAQAAYEPNSLPNVPGTAPAGWNTLVGEDLGYVGNITDGFFRGNYFISGYQSYFSAAARVMEQDGTLVVSFQGTESLLETVLYPQIDGNDEYIQNFDALLEAVAAYAADEGNDIDTIWITGHSLGAGAVAQLRNVSATEYGGAFDDAVYVSFANPEFFPDDVGILNIGYENDDVFKSEEPGKPDYATATNNIVYYDASYVFPTPQAGQTALEIADLAVNLLLVHNIPNYINGITQILGSEFYDEMTRDSVVVVDDFIGTVRASTVTDHLGADIYFIGSDDDDRIVAGTGNDSLEGFDGNDVLVGGGGDDWLLGGAGNDLIFGQSGQDVMNGGAGDDTMYGGRGADVVVFDFSAPIGDDTVYFNPFQDTLVIENSGLTELEVALAYDGGFGFGVFDFGEAGSITLIGPGMAIGFDPGDVILL